MQETMTNWHKIDNLYNKMMFMKHFSIVMNQLCSLVTKIDIRSR